MRVVTIVLTSLVLMLSSIALSAAAQQDGTCEHPMLVPEPPREGDPMSVTFDTRLFTNHEEAGSGCDSLVLTGPEIFLAFGACAAGTVSWTADFDAVVYTLKSECGTPGCADVSTDGQLGFDAGYVAPDDFGHGASCGTLFVVVDGINGAAGLITLTFEYGYGVPTLSWSWGRLKGQYR